MVSKLDPELMRGTAWDTMTYPLLPGDPKTASPKIASEQKILFDQMRLSDTYFYAKTYIVIAEGALRSSKMTYGILCHTLSGAISH